MEGSAGRLLGGAIDSCGDRSRTRAAPVASDAGLVWFGSVRFGVDISARLPRDGRDLSSLSVGIAEVEFRVSPVPLSDRRHFAPQKDGAESCLSQ